MQSRTIWVVFTNTDLTEGRGRRVPIEYSFNEFTARRLASKKGVMGSDAEVIGYSTSVFEGDEYVDIRLLNISFSTKEDEDLEIATKKKADAIKRLTESGASLEDLIILGVKV